MAALNVNVRTVLSVRRFDSYRYLHGYQTLRYCTNKSKEETGEKLSGFAESFIKQSKINEPPPPETFPALLRKSKFIDLGDPEGKKVVGTIYHVRGDDLYIDFGWKLPAVCPVPRKNPELYIRGAKVQLMIKDLELSTRFLGSQTDITLCEADCILLGLIK